MPKAKKRILVYKRQGFQSEIRPVKKKNETTDTTERNRLLRGINFATELGFIIILPIAGGIVVGYWIDSKLNTHPRFTLFLLVLGIMVGSYSLYKEIKTVE